MGKATQQKVDSQQKVAKQIHKQASAKVQKEKNNAAAAKLSKKNNKLIKWKVKEKFRLAKVKKQTKKMAKNMRQVMRKVQRKHSALKRRLIHASARVMRKQDKKYKKWQEKKFSKEGKTLHAYHLQA